MKTFKDLEFKSHQYLPGLQANLEFKNGYAVSVLCGEKFYSNGMDTYELAVLDETGSITYTTDITDDVLGYQTIGEITEAMKKVQLL